MVEYRGKGAVDSLEVNMLLGHEDQAKWHIATPHDIKEPDLDCIKRANVDVWI